MLDPIIFHDEKGNVPEWALLQRKLFDLLDDAAIEFADRYTRDDGTLIWRESWAGMDGADDPYEGFMHMPLYYALGGSRDVYLRSRLIYDSLTWQWTEYGQLEKEFTAYYDWMHHGEGYLFFYFLGLADAGSLKDQQRTEKFASYYDGSDPSVQNFDPQLNLMRAPITGSRGPRHVHTAEDWSTHRGVLDQYMPPFEDVPGVSTYADKCPWSDDETYEAILSLINQRMSRGDVPLNLGATSLLTHAFMYRGDEHRRRWVLEYLDAWRERTKINNGITPDNVGLSGKIGEYNQGKWWGGYYGWWWPHGAKTVLEPLCVSATNAMLLTGDSDQLDLARSQLDLLWSLRKDESGSSLVPNRHSSEGWFDYKPINPMFAVYLWNVSQAKEDAERVERGWPHAYFDDIDRSYRSRTKMTGSHAAFNANTSQWYKFIQGDYPNYPVEILRANLEMIEEQIAVFRSEKFDPLTMDDPNDPMAIHVWQELSPMLLEGLAQLTLGGPMYIYHGGLMHVRFRYFDPESKRPGLPKNVATLVESVESDRARLIIANTDDKFTRDVIIQGGAFGEHEILSAKTIGMDSKRMPVDEKYLCISVAAGSVLHLDVEMERYANSPSYDTPWQKTCESVELISSRKA